MRRPRPLSPLHLLHDLLPNARPDFVPRRRCPAVLLRLHEVALDGSPYPDHTPTPTVYRRCQVTPILGRRIEPGAVDSEVPAGGPNNGQTGNNDVVRRGAWQSTRV
jgi:hypothetical protein